MVASLSQRADVKNFLKGLLVIVSGAFMVLPAYLNYEIFNRLHFQLVASMSISLTLFAVGIVTLILVLGKDAFEPKPGAQ